MGCSANAGAGEPVSRRDQLDILRWKQAFTDGRLPHAILIAGAAGSGKKAVARTAAAWYLFGCDDTAALDGCPFLFTTDSAAADDVRDMAHEFMGETYARGRRVLLLPDVHLLNEHAQNALLHTIEEPPADALVLLTGNETGILPTIRSRCMILRMGAVEERDVCARLERAGVSRERAARAAHMANGVPGVAERYATDEFSAFADAADAILLRWLSGDPCYAEAAQLVTKREEGDDGKKKQRVSADAVSDLCDVFLSRLTDAMCAATGAPCADGTGRKIASGFTLQRISRMIGLVLDAKRGLTFRAAPQQTLDAMLAKISLV